jgi:hypothetical protein
MSIADLKVRLADVPEIIDGSAGGSDVSAEGRRQDHARASPAPMADRIKQELTKMELVAPPFPAGMGERGAGPNWKPMRSITGKSCRHCLEWAMTMRRDY